MDSNNFEKNEETILRSKSQEKQTLKKKKSKSEKIRINTNKCRGELQLLKILINKNKWDEVFDEKADIFWSGLNLHVDEFPLGLKTKINRIPGMTQLAHKKNTAYYLNKFREYFPESYNFFPKTFIIPEELEKFKRFIDKENRTMIAKPTAGSQGDGIYLIKSFKELPFVKNGFIENKDYVVQTYIDRPLLIDKKKFDLRLYVLISSVKPFIAYLNDEGLARFCTEDYAEPNSSNAANNFVHLSNYSLNKNSASYKFVNDKNTVEEINEGSKRSLTSFWKTMAKYNISKETVTSKIEALIIKFLSSIYPFILYNYKCMFGRKEASCFQVLGFDIILDQDLEPYLLEINANPSLSIVFDPHENDPKLELKKKEISFVDLFVKEKVVEDCLKIVHMSSDKQLQINTGDRFGSYKKLINGDVDAGTESSELSLFTKMLEVFGYLSGFKFNDYLNSTRFSKLGTLSYLSYNGFNRNGTDILFKQIVKGNKAMDFYMFIEAIEIISSKIVGGFNADDKLSAVSAVVDNIFRELNLSL